MDNLEWIRDLAMTEKKLDEDGFFEAMNVFDLDRILTQESVNFMLNLRLRFNDVIYQFNEVKFTADGRIKLFQVANTHMDFMLFRNSYKMVFSLREPGRVSIKFNFRTGQYIPFQNHLAIDASMDNKPESELMSEHTIMAKWGPFHEVLWSFRDQMINVEYLVKYYMSYFIQESLK
jgi:hypothetical protein